MSSIAWHFEDVELRMGGREAAWMRCLVRGMALSAAKLALPMDKQPASYAFFQEGFGDSLETAWTMGSRPVRLAAVIVGCVELNLVIEGEAFAEVADTLEEGLASGIFREETQGYEGVRAIIERLRKGGAWVALSYSVTDGFPRRVRREDVPDIEPDPEQIEDVEDEGEWVYLTPEQTVALVRRDGPTLAAGELAAPSFFNASMPVFKMDVDALSALVGVEQRR